MRNIKEKRPNGLIVLSLFDGMSCGRMALENANIKIEKYMASEIKPFAIEHTLKHYPSTLQLGDVTRIHYKDGVLYYDCQRKLIDSLANHPKKTKWSKKELDYFKTHNLEVCDNGEVYKWCCKKASIAHIGKIDLLIGGSPCKQFSSAFYFCKKVEEQGLKGKDSSLFYEYLRLLKEIEPTFFFLENVKMKKESEDTLTSYLNVKPLAINSNLLTYQNRARVYWTNIEGISIPKDANVNFQDYLIRTLPRVEHILRYNKFHEAKLPLALSNDEVDAIIASNRWVYDELISEDATLTKEEVVNIIHEQLVETIAKNAPFRDKILYGDKDGKYKNKNLSLPTSTKIGALTRRQDRNPCSGVILFDDFYRYLNTFEQARAQDVPLSYVRDLRWKDASDILGDGWTISVVAHCFTYLNDKYDFE